MEAFKDDIYKKKEAEAEAHLDRVDDVDLETTVDMYLSLSDSLQLVLSDESMTGNTLVIDHKIEFSLMGTSSTQCSARVSGDTLIIDHGETFSEIDPGASLVLDVDDIDESLIDDSWIDPDWNVQEEEEESSLSTENDDVLDDSVFLAEAPKGVPPKPKKLVEYSFSDESFTDVEELPSKLVGVDGFDLEADESVVWSVSDASDDDGEIGEQMTLSENLAEGEINHEATNAESNIPEVARVLLYSSGSESSHSPKQNRDLLTPPSQPSTGPSSPVSVPTTPAAFGPRTPRVAAQPTTVMNTPTLDSPFRRLPNTLVTSSPIPLPQTSDVSLNGALTYR